MMVMAEKWKDVLSLFMKSRSTYFHFPLLLFMDDGWYCGWKVKGRTFTLRMKVSCVSSSTSIFTFSRSSFTIASWVGRKHYCYCFFFFFKLLLLFFLLQLFFVQKVFSWEEGNVNGGCWQEKGWWELLAENLLVVNIPSLCCCCCYCYCHCFCYCYWLRTFL